MPSQQRAERTRRRLVQAAATEFARHGYDATSLVRISKRAGVTMGGLAFHFRAKLDLARSVFGYGANATRAATVRVGEWDQTPLQSVIDITHVLAGLLTEDPTVRAAGRLSQEVEQIGASWDDSWMPPVRRLLQQAARRDMLLPAAEPDSVAVLVRYLVAGIEMTARAEDAEGAASATSATSATSAASDGPALPHRLAAIWGMMLPGLAPDPERLRTGAVRAP